MTPKNVAMIATCLVMVLPAATFFLAPPLTFSRRTMVCRLVGGSRGGNKRGGCEWLCVESTRSMPDGYCHAAYHALLTEIII